MMSCRVMGSKGGCQLMVFPRITNIKDGHQLTVSARVCRGMADDR